MNKRLEKAFLDDTVEGNFFELTDPPGILLSILADRANRNIDLHIAIKSNFLLQLIFAPFGGSAELPETVGIRMKNQIDDIKNSISRYLSMREHSRLEIFEKLIRKDFDQTLIDQCLLEFSTNNLLSDQRYTETFIRSKYNNGKGPSFIKASLI